MAVEGIWTPTLHQGKSPASHGTCLWWHRCGGMPSLDTACQGFFPPLPGQTKCGLWCGWSPVAWPSTETWCCGWVMHLFVYFCTLFLHGLTVHKWQTHKISVCFYKCYVWMHNISVLSFCTSAECTVFFCFATCINLQWTINIYFSSFMSWALCFLFFYVVFSDCSIVFLILIDSGTIWQHSSVLSTDWTVLRWKFGFARRVWGFVNVAWKLGFVFTV